MTRCGAKTRAGGVCAQPGYGLGGRCKHHGGMSVPAGPGHHSYKNGLRSKAIPARLRERIAAADSDPAVLSHRRDLAILDELLEEQLERLSEGGTGRALTAIRAAWRDVLAVRADPEQLVPAMEALGKIIEGSSDEERSRAEAVRLIGARREQAQYEHRRTLELSQAIRPDELGAVLARVAQIVMQEIPDKDVRLRIGRALELLANAPDLVN